MRNKKIFIISVAILLIFTFESFTNFSSATTGTGIPSSYYQKYPGTLTYDVLNFNASNSVDWYLYVDGNASHDIFRGYASTNDGGKIVVNISSFADMGPGLWVINDNPVPYGNISIFKSGETNANFTADNVSVTEMAYVLLLGYMSWCPGFLAPTNWTANGEKALSQATGYFTSKVSIVNTTDTVKYIFEQQNGTVLQDTTLLYNRTSGVLLEAITNFGNYELHIKLETNSQTIDVFLPITLFISGIIGISVIWLKYQRKITKK